MIYNKYTLFGYPLRFSLSPQIQQAFAAQFGLKIEYNLTPVQPEQFQTAWNTFFANGGKGANITAPYKEQAYHQVASLTPRAKIARAINTVVVQEDGTLLGDNTDGVGLIKDFAYLGIVVKQKHIVIIGAGGAVRGIVPALFALQPQKITIVNRDLKKAELLLNDFANFGNLEISAYDQLSKICADIVINATSVSPAASGAIYYDLNYAPNTVPHTYNGIGMLIEQAAAAFTLWHGSAPDTIAVRDADFLKQRT